MSKKLKKAIKDSFVFPESAHKDDFFNDLQPVYTEEKKRAISWVFRLTAASAALIIGAGVWTAVKIHPEHSEHDISVTEPAITDITTSEAVSETSVSAAAETKTATRTTASSSQTRTSSGFPGTTTATKSTNSSKKSAVTSVSVGAAVKTAAASAPADNVTASVTTATSDLISDAERSFSMKKISAFAASLIFAASNASVLPTNAETNPCAFLDFLRNDSAFYLTINKSAVNNVADKEADLDLNEDGSFDMWDLYAFYRGMNDHNNHDEVIVHGDRTETFIPPVFTAPENITENVVKYGDLNGDKEIDRDDFEILAYYYSINYNSTLTYDSIDPNNYYFNCPDDYDDTQYSYHFTTPDDKWTFTRFYDLDIYRNPDPIIQFVFDFVDCNSDAYGGYSIFCDMIDKGLIDLDVNGDGQFTIDELCDHIEAARLCYWESLPEYGVDDSEEYETARNTYFTEEEWEKLRSNCNYARFSLNYAFEYDRYFVNYFFNHNEFKRAYGEDHYFDNMRGGFFSISAHNHMFDCMKYAMPGVYSARFDFTQEETKNDFISYFTRVKNGELPEPDINMNGTIEFEDYIYADLMLMKDSFKNDPKYPEFDQAIIDNFNKNCDFNRNEISGDLSDVISIQLYVVKELGIPEDDIKDEMARYFKKHPEIDLFDYAHYVLPEEEELPEFVDKDMAKTGLTSIRVYMSNIDLFIPRNGDANADGDVDMSDSVLIMQSFSNPDKYTLTDDGLFNADINETGDGITPKDAQKIQKKLLFLD